MSGVTAQDIAGLATKVNQLTNTLSDKGFELANFRESDAGPAVSFYRSSQRDAMHKSVGYGRPLLRGERVTLPKGYEAGQFGSFGQFLQTMAVDPVKFSNTFAKSADSLAKSLTLAKGVTVNSSDFTRGGALVLPEFAPEIMRMMYESDSLWSRTRQYTVNGNSMKFPRLRDTDRTDGNRHGGVLAYWQGQGISVSQTGPQFDGTDVDLDELCVAIFVNRHILEDSAYLVEQLVSELATEEIDFKADQALIRGTGSQQPLGIINSSSRVTVAKESGQLADTIVADNILNMWKRRLQGSVSDDLVWLVNQDTEAQLAKLTLATGTASGQLTYQPPGAFADRPYATLMGRPVITSEHCSKLGDEGDIILTNFRYYLAINKGQVNQLSSPHVEFLKQNMCFLFTFRIGGRPAYEAPVTPSQSAETQSAIVTLEARG